LPQGYFARVNSALESAQIFGDVLVFDLQQVDHPEIVAEMADFLLRAEGVETVLGSGEYADEGILSLRSSDQSVNAGHLIQAVTAGFGSAGGHGQIAGGQIRPLPVDAAGRLALRRELVRRLLAALGKSNCRPRPLLPA
jgi:nanoRNase/pAp phosphatase (c-di-AMP/oligoRNAs hydrolase)